MVAMGLPVLVLRLEQQLQRVGALLVLKSHNVVIASALENLGQISSVDTQSNILIATVVVKALGFHAMDGEIPFHTT